MTDLRRARLEVDRTLRSRPFFSRALSGYLERPEYIDLIEKLGGLASIAVGPEAEPLLELQAQDLAQLSPTRRTATMSACPPLNLMNEACRCWGEVLTPDERWVASVGMLGTSWTSEATTRLAIRYPGATSMLEELGVRGPMSDLRLRRSGRGCRQEVTAAAEMVHGALLGLAAYLDAKWPAPVAFVTVRGGA